MDEKRKTEKQRIIQAIMDTLQEVYGDATQTVLDHRAATAVWKRLEEMGVAPASGVAAIVAAAGGEVTIPDALLLDPPTEYAVMGEPLLGGTVVRTRTKAKAA